MRSFLIFVATVAGMLSIIPLSIWAATGRWRAGVAAGWAFAKLIGAMVLAGLLLAAVMGIASIL